MLIDLKLIIGLVVAPILAVVSVVAGFVCMGYIGRLLSKPTEDGPAINVFATLALMFGSLALVTATGFALMPWVLRMENPTLKVICGTVAVATVAGGLFALKVWDLRSYAVIELAFATGLTVLTMNGLPEHIPVLQAVSLIGSAYLFAKGMEDFKRDLDSRPPMSKGPFVRLDLFPRQELNSQKAIPPETQSELTLLNLSKPPSERAGSMCRDDSPQ